MRIGTIRDVRVGDVFRRVEGLKRLRGWRICLSISTNSSYHAVTDVVFVRDGRIIKWNFPDKVMFEIVE